MSSFPALVPSPPPAAAAAAASSALAAAAPAGPAAAAPPPSSLVSPRAKQHQQHMRNGSRRSGGGGGGGSISAASTTASPSLSPPAALSEPLSPASFRSSTGADRDSTADSSADSPGSQASSSSSAISMHSGTNMLPSAALSASSSSSSAIVAASAASASSAAAAAQPGARIGKILLSSPRTSQQNQQVARKSSLTMPAHVARKSSVPLSLSSQLQPQPPAVGPQSTPPKRRSDPSAARQGRNIANGQLAALAAAGGPAGGAPAFSRQPSRKETAAAAAAATTSPAAPAINARLAAPPRKASVVRQGSNTRPVGFVPSGAATTRERLGRNGQPLSKLPSRPAQPTPMQAYILASKGQLGLMEPGGRAAQRMLSRFDPLVDDDDDDDNHALVPPSPATSSAIALASTGPSQITALVAAQHAATKWATATAGASDSPKTGASVDPGVLHIAAGIMLPTMTAASLSPVLAQAQAQARAQATPTTPSSSTPTAAAAAAAVATPTSAAVCSAATANSNSTTVSPTKTVAAAAGAGGALAAPVPSGHSRARSHGGGGGGGHSRNPSTVSLTDLALSQARRTSWEMEYPAEAAAGIGANAQRQAITAAEDLEQEALAAALEAAEAAAEALAAQARATEAQAAAQAKAREAQALAAAAKAAVAALAAPVPSTVVASSSAAAVPPAVSVSTPSSNSAHSAHSIGSGSGSEHATPTSAAGGASALSTPSPASSSPSAGTAAAAAAHVRFSPSAAAGPAAAANNKPNSAGGGNSSPIVLQSRIQHRRMHSRDVDSPLSPRSALPASSPATANHSSSSSPHFGARGKRESSLSSNAADVDSSPSHNHSSSSNNPQRGRIERKPSQPNSVSGSPLVAVAGGSPALVPTAMLPASVVCISPMSTGPPTVAAADSFQQANSAQMSPDAVQDRWKRALIKRMSVGISFAPSPFSGLLGSTAAPAQSSGAPAASPTLSSAASPGSPQSGSVGVQRTKSGSFSKETSSGGKDGEMASPRAGGSSHRQSMRRGSIQRDSPLLQQQPTPASPQPSGGGGGGGGGRHSRTPSQAAARFALRQSMTPAAAHPPPLAILQLQNAVHHTPASSPGDSAQPYPHHPSFSYLFPHQELLAQQREYYSACNQKLLDYCQWVSAGTDAHLDPVVVPASSYPLYQHAPHRRSNGGRQHAHRESGNSSSNNGAMAMVSADGSPLPSSSYPSYALPFPAYPVPPSFPSSFDVDFWQCYSSIQHWGSFDIFAFSELTRGWPLSFMFVIVLHKSDLIRTLGLDLQVVFRFIQEVESHYLPNPYHTSIHAADVLHAVYHFLNDSSLRGCVSDLDKFLLYVAASIHDFAHPGVNNSFLVNSKAPLAIRYNDRGVLENFHVSSSFRMMQLTEGCNILERWERDSSKEGTRVFTRARKLIIDLVLATDLAAHFDLMRVMKSRFESIVGEAVAAQTATAAGADGAGAAGAAGADTETPPLPLPLLSPSPSASPAPSLSSPSASSSSPPTAVGTPAPASPGGAPVGAAAAVSSSSPRALSSIRSPEVPPSPPLKLSLQSDDDLVLVLQLLLKLGDLSHPARPKGLHLRWAELVTEEFFSQGDRERSLNLAPSPFMDRNTTAVATSQMGFLTYLVRPLFELAGHLQGNSFWTRQVERNLELWGELEKIEQREQRAKEMEEELRAQREREGGGGGGGALAGAPPPQHPSTISENGGSGSGSSSADHSYTGGSIAHLLPPDHNSSGSGGGSGGSSNPPGGPIPAGPGDPHHSPTLSSMRSPPLQGVTPKSSAGSPLIPGSPLMEGVDLSLYPSQNRAHLLSSTSVSSAGSGASSAMSSGSGSITGRFSSYCKDRTVLSMFKKARDAFDYHASGDEEHSLPQHAHARFEGVNEISRPSSSNAASTNSGAASATALLTFDRLPSVPTATASAAAAAAAGTITEEPLNAHAFTDRDSDRPTPLQGSTRTSLERERDAMRPAPIIVTAVPWSSSVHPPPMQTATAQ